MDTRDNDTVDAHQNEEENNNVDVSSLDDQPEANTTSTNTVTINTSSAGLQQIEDDNNHMPRPNRADNVEQIDDDIGPEPPAAVLEESLNTAEKSNEMIRASLESVNTDNEHNLPTPFNSAAEFEADEDAIAKKKGKDEITNQNPAAVSNTNEEEQTNMPLVEESVDIPTSEHIESMDEIRGITNTEEGGINRRVEIESRNAQDIESQTRTDNNVTAGSINDAIIDTEANVVFSTNQEAGDNTADIHIPEAFLVEDGDGEVYDATPVEPTIPWWKQKRTRILIGVVLIIVATLSIALGVSLSKDTNTNARIRTVSLAPSSSMAPSSSPTECVNKIISNAQEIDLKGDLQIKDPQMPIVAADGRNMVVVALDGKYYTTADKSYWGQYYGPAFIIFYLLDNMNEWLRVQTPIRVDDVSDSDGRAYYSVSLSGSTAFIGFPDANDGAGTVLVYEQNQFNEWERVADPFVHITNTIKKWFGRSVDIDGNLACVEDWDVMNLYHRDDDSKWVQFDAIEGGYECTISGDTIAVDTWGDDDWSIQLYSYNQNQNEVVLIQDPIHTERSAQWT